MKPAISALVLALVVAAAGCTQPLHVAGPTLNVPPPAASPVWGDLVDEYIEGNFAFNPPSAVRAGRHEFDGQLAAFTRESFRRNGERLHGLGPGGRPFDATGLNPNLAPGTAALIRLIRT